MPEIVRERDVIVLVKDLAYPVQLTSAMAQAGWPGGQGVKWADSGKDDFTVTFSDGEVAAFLLWGSNESSDQFISYTENQPTYGFGTACAGTWIVSTSTYERYTLQSRLVPPLVQNVYVPGNRLRFSLRGYFTPQDEWTISGDPRAPNTFFVGTIVQAPTADNNLQLMVETII
jgi:hypothetical protein